MLYVVVHQKAENMIDKTAHNPKTIIIPAPSFAIAIPLPFSIPDNLHHQNFVNLLGIAGFPGY